MDVQRKTAEDRLKVIGAEWRDNRWHLPRLNLERFCKPEGEADPQSVVEWRPPERVKYRKLRAGLCGAERIERFRCRDEFFHEFAKSGWFKSPLSAETYFMAFCKHMLHTLVNEQKPVDLGFALICPVPLRVNWKALLLQRHLKNSVAPPRVANSELLQMVAQEVTKPEYLAWERPHRLVWGLEILPDKAWHRAAAQVARAYMSRKYNTAKHREVRYYCCRCRDGIKRSLPWLTRLYATYLSNIKLPGARLLAVILPSGKASTKPSQQRGVTVRVDPPDLVPQRYDARLSPPVTTAEGLEDTNGENTDLRSMPDLRQGTEDLRGAEC